VWVLPEIYLFTKTKTTYDRTEHKDKKTSNIIETLYRSVVDASCGLATTVTVTTLTRVVGTGGISSSSTFQQLSFSPEQLEEETGSRSSNQPYFACQNPPQVETHRHLREQELEQEQEQEQEQQQQQLLLLLRILLLKLIILATMTIPVRMTIF